MDEVRAAAAYWQQRAIQAERDALLTKIALVHATGGEIVVPRDCLHDARALELVVDERLYDGN